MVSLRVQHLQLLASLAAGLCCLGLGALSLSTGLVDYRRVLLGTETFQRFEILSDAANAVAAERAPANVLIATGTSDSSRVAAVRNARATTDRLLGLAEVSLRNPRDGSRTALYALNEVRARLAVGRQLVDTFIVMDTSARTSNDFKLAMEEMFATATAGDVLRDKAGQDVIAVAPEVSIEVFLSLAIGALRDQAGRLGSYVVLTQREGRRELATQRMLQEAAGRVAASRRILSTLTHALPAGNKVVTQLAQVERHFFDGTLRLGLDTAASVGSGNEVGTATFAVDYAQGLASIDKLRDVIIESSRARLKVLGDAAFNRAAIAGTLTVLVCLILLGNIIVFRRALFVPLGQAREQAIAIARGDLSEPTSDRRAAGEVGEMLAGLDAIRGDQRWRREFEEQQAEMARQLKRLSETDMLTGLLNRRAMEELAKRTIVRANEGGERVGLLLFDVDHFKSINDTFGHGVGDDVLRTIARQLSSLLRPEDAFARFGGEEFIVLMPNIQPARARALAERLRSELPKLVRVPDENRRVTASFGLVLREPGSTTTWDALVAAADRRLYAAKRAGRNRVCESDLAVLPGVVA